MSSPLVLDSSQAWVVLKFGGTSVSTLQNWRNIASVLNSRIAASFRPVVVHSALSGITDRLESLLAAKDRSHLELLDRIEAAHVHLAQQLNVALGPRFDGFMQELRQMASELAHGRRSDDVFRARLMAMGELLATSLGAQYLNAQGVGTVWVDARQVLHAEERDGSTRKSSVLSATCDFSPDPKLQTDWRALNQVVITQGFIASNAAGETVLLGRGGSDTSGAYFAAKLNAARLEIWTDVPGLFSANPRAVPTARLLRQLHYDEAQEIASNGAKVLHPRCILPLRQYRIPLHVYATQAPGLEGTVISANAADSAAQVKAIAIRKGITLVSMESPGMWHQVGFLADAFQVFKQHGLSVDLVSTSETNVTVSLDPSANALDGAALERLTLELERALQGRNSGAVRLVESAGSEYSRHPARTGFGLRIVSGPEDLSGDAGRQRFEFHFRHRRMPGRSSGAAAARTTHSKHWQRMRCSGPPGRSCFPTKTKDANLKLNWWQEPHKRRALLEIAARESAAFVYDMATLDAAVAAVLLVKSVKRWAYAMKANWHAEILRRVYAAGLSLECVSQGELEHAFASVPGARA